MKGIAVGGEDFIALRKADRYYVDKTEILFELAESGNAVSLITRPRRFGKTLTMKMMESFFSADTRKDSWIFDGLSVKRHTEFCDEYMNQYPTLFVSLKDVEGRNFELAYAKLETVISDVCKKLIFLLEADQTDAADKEIFERLRYKTAGEEEVQNSLKTLMRMMRDVYGKPVILLLDEYDVPLAKAHANGYYYEMLDVIRGIMSTSLKTNEYLKFAVITGCLRIPKESIFTGVNNFAVYSVLNEDFSQYFGFTHSEVKEMLDSFGLEEKVRTVREWYDGYVFGNTEVYCPWDVANYLSALLKRRNARPGNYWKNTSGNEAIREFFRNKKIDVTRKLEVLLNGGTISETVVDQLTYENAYESEMNLWSILLMTGYVTLAHPVDDVEGEQEADIRIPNKEIAGIFQETVADHFKQTIEETKLNTLMDALWEGEEAIVSEVMSDLLLRTISYMDYHEDYYHAFLTGLFRGRGFEVESNKERGLGRPDIQLIDNANRRVVIIETKKSATAESMSADCQEGINQIIEGKYAAGFEDYRSVICYGISFFQKTALAKKMK